MTDLDELKAYFDLRKNLPDTIHGIYDVEGRAVLRSSVVLALIERVEKAEAINLDLQSEASVHSLCFDKAVRERDARISELEAALRPFAKAFAGQKALYGDTDNNTQRMIEWGHLRTASRALGGDNE